ncbi:unnamed protein product, partial [Darwinula stevensoni]
MQGKLKKARCGLSTGPGCFYDPDRDDDDMICYCNSTLCNDKDNHGFPPDSLECYDCDDEKECGDDVALWSTQKCVGPTPGGNQWHCSSEWQDGKLKKARCGLSTGPGCFYDPDRDDDDMICYCNSTLCNDKDNHGFPPDSLECYDCDDEKECGQDAKHICLPAGYQLELMSASKLNSSWSKPIYNPASYQLEMSVYRLDSGGAVVAHLTSQEARVRFTAVPSFFLFVLSCHPTLPSRPPALQYSG